MKSGIIVKTEFALEFYLEVFMDIKKIEPQDCSEAAELAVQLWKRTAREEIIQEFLDIIQSDEGVIYLGMEDGRAVGFAQCQLRHDYVEGTRTSPVGYLEGIFLLRAYRGKGRAEQLLSACEEWAAGKGCREFASDCEISNEASLKFHLKSGFQEANRIICFTKPLQEHDGE